MPIITPPGSKSITNRILLLQYLSKSVIKLENFVLCDDTRHMTEGLFKLLTEKKPNLYTGNAGTATRFLTAAATLSNKEVKISGNNRMNSRPIAQLTTALNSLGAKIKTNRGCPPVIISPQIPKGGTINLEGDTSSQYLSALLMIAPFLENPTTINIEQKLCSKPYVEITLNLLRQFKVKIVNNNFRQFKIAPQTPTPPKKFKIESDASSASYFGAYAALHPDKTIKLKNITKKSIQGDIIFLDYLKEMGCEITYSKNSTKIKGPKKLKSLNTVNMNKSPDLVMTFAILSMFTQSPTKITHIPNLKIKETDRLKALKNEIGKFGIKVKTTADSIEIHGNPNLNITKKIPINTYDDHRIAMAFGILSHKFPITIQNKSCVSKSYPGFFRDLNLLK